MAARPEITAWCPQVEGIEEVFHAHFADHAYPMHTHDAWTLLIVDEGIVRYDLDRHEHGAPSSVVTLLPARTAQRRCGDTEGFRKRVLYLGAAEIDEASSAWRSTVRYCTIRRCVTVFINSTGRSSGPVTSSRPRAGSRSSPNTWPGICAAGSTCPSRCGTAESPTSFVICSTRSSSRDYPCRKRRAVSMPITPIW
ncbi:AraC family ligand binding domain-containing protein [Streptomyces sp. M10(2022)]